MPSLYPNAIQTFPQMIDATASDGVLISQYQLAMEAGNLSLAKQILEQHFEKRYSPAYIVSPTQPQNQEATDFWFQVTG